MSGKLLCGIATLGLLVGMGGLNAADENESVQEQQRERAEQRREQAEERRERAQERREASREGKLSEELPASMARLSDIDGIAVYGTNDKELGDIQDVVVDLRTGQVEYAVLSFGGFLGLGDKLFAVPWRALKMQQTQDDEHHFVLSTSEEQLKNAPGFDDENWPNFADEQFASDVHEFYGVERRAFRPQGDRQRDTRQDRQRPGNRDRKNRDRQNNQTQPERDRP